MNAPAALKPDFTAIIPWADQIGKPHPAPIVYRDMHVHLDGSQACYVICLGEIVWGATWPKLKADIDRILSTDRVCAGDEPEESPRAWFDASARHPDHPGGF